MKKLYAIYSGLRGGFGGATWVCLEKCETEEDALEYARCYAVEDYQSYEGSLGILTEDECEEEGVEYGEEIDSWIDYYVVEITLDNYKKFLEELDEMSANRIVNYINTTYNI